MIGNRSHNPLTCTAKPVASMQLELCIHVSRAIEATLDVFHGLLISIFTLDICHSVKTLDNGGSLSQDISWPTVKIGISHYPLLSEINTCGDWASESIANVVGVAHRRRDSRPSRYHNSSITTVGPPGVVTPDRPSGEAIIDLCRPEGNFRLLAWRRMTRRRLPDSVTCPCIPLWLFA